MKIRFSDFPRSFWIANLMELFERGAYYGLNSILAVYLASKVSEGGLGFDEQSVGLLQGLLYAAVYSIPIVGGALADRYGYRRMLLVAFSLLGSGYALAGQVRGYGLIFLFLMVMAVGGGLFKPIISGTIARTTDKRTSSVGFGIFYWIINVGAFLSPLVVNQLKDFSWRWVFLASALYTSAMILPALFFYRDPPRPKSTKSLREVLVGSVEVLGDSRFVLMIVVYSCFWILYFQNFGTVLWYLGEFVDTTPIDAGVNRLLDFLGITGRFRFAAEHVTVLNAGTIILLQFFVSRIVRARAALPTMMTGMSIGALGFLLLASSQNGWIFVLGILVFSLGEMTAHPKYISFVGLIAPAERKAVYMGYAFLYGVFGSLIGSNLGAIAYQSFLKPVAGSDLASSRAAWFWALFAVVDLAAVLGLFVFSKVFGADTPRTRRQAQSVMNAVYGLLLVLGLGFFAWGLTRSPVAFKTLVQASLFILLGGAGLGLSLRRRAVPSFDVPDAKVAP